LIDYSVVDARQPIIDCPPYSAWHPKGILDTEWFWLQKYRKRVRGYEQVPGHDGGYKSRGSMTASEGCVRNQTNCMDLRTCGNST